MSDTSSVRALRVSFQLWHWPDGADGFTGVTWHGPPDSGFCRPVLTASAGTEI
ncbi:hypothetical protein [Streptomyces sp. NPDC086787]|uniref:hypothetical protein n=1 Tax=Streptomyces sp. NPDC086787 TaxID=3365759 RepID=UPI003803DA09